MCVAAAAAAGRNEVESVTACVCVCAVGAAAAGLPKETKDEDMGEMRITKETKEHVFCASGAEMRLLKSES